MVFGGLFGPVLVLAEGEGDGVSCVLVSWGMVVACEVKAIVWSRRGMGG